MTQCEVPAVPELHPALAERFSPVRFDAIAEVSDTHVDVLLEAARRTPSAGNSQPWRFVVGRRGDGVHERLVRHLARSSSVWAPDASLLVLNLAHTRVEGSEDFEFSEFALYDVGQAVAHMTIQGLTMGLHAHQFRAFDREGLAAEFGVPAHWDVVSMTAFGTAAHGKGEVVSAGTSQERLGTAELTWARVTG